MSASAIGIYGNRGDEELDEGSLFGTGFLADVCREWEAATEPALQAGIRVVNLRLGIVLTAAGTIMTPFLTSLWALALAYGLVGIAQGYMQPLSMSLVSGQAGATRLQPRSGWVNSRRNAPHPPLASSRFSSPERPHPRTVKRQRRGIATGPPRERSRHGPCSSVRAPGPPSSPAPGGDSHA